MWPSRQCVASCAAALLAIVIIGTADAQSQPPPPSAGKPGKPPQDQPRRREQPAARDERGTENSPIAVKIIPTPKTETEAAQDKAERDAKATTDRRMVWLTGALVLVGAIQAFVFFIQARRLRETIDATRDTTDVMRDTAQRQLRGYVFATEGRVVNLANPGLAPVAQVIIKNAGQTPAYNVTCAIGFGADPPIDPDQIVPRNVTTKASLAPGGDTEQRSEAPGPLNSALHAHILRGTKVLYVFGVIRYADIFETKHFTRYRFMTDGDTHKSGSLIICAEGNEAD
jgi:hypothetical protein